ncbi:MAG: hypothetical protein ACYDCK_07525 [Thermoplasmatota archaeon]
MTAIVDWAPETRRRGGIGALVGVVVLLVAGFVVEAVVPTDAATLVLYGLIVVVVLLIVFLVLLLVLKPRGAQPTEAAAATAEEEALADIPDLPAESSSLPGSEDVVATPPPATPAGVLTLKCGECGTIFDVNDTGERPLYHTCPGCGTEGVLR